MKENQEIPVPKGVQFHTGLEVGLVDRLDKLYIKKITELEKSLEGCDITFTKIGSLGLEIAIFKAELDILISVKKKDFEKVKDLVGTMSHKKHEQILWDENYALFNGEESLKYAQYDTVSVDYIIAVSGSERDTHYKKTRKFLETNPKVQWKYNMLKMEFHSKPYAEYSKAKWAFWDKYKDAIDATEL